MAKAPASQHLCNSASKVAQVSGKTIGVAAVSIATLHGAVPANTVILGWAIPALSDAETGASRAAFMVGDAAGQKREIAAGMDLDTTVFPVLDPTQVFVRRRAGAADVTNVVVEIYYGNIGDVTV